MTVTRQPGETAASALKPSHSSPDHVRAPLPAFLFLSNMNTVYKRQNEQAVHSLTGH